MLGTEGDGFFVAFGSAGDAVAAAADGQRALAGYDWPDGYAIRVRMGVHTGEPRAVDGNYVGLDVHHAARVMAAGHGGQVLVSQATRSLLGGVELRDLGEHLLKDLAGPQRLYQLELDGLPGEFPPLNTLENRFTSLPAVPNAFVGRERELAEAGALLARDDVRLLTLIGPGGTGKTRLALQVASGLVDELPGGAAFVSLTPVRDWELVMPAIAQALGLREQPEESALETLVEYLRDKRLLLVLDNFEQVLAAAPALSSLLAEAPGVKLLVTSRTPLRLSQERVYRVPQLDCRMRSSCSPSAPRRPRPTSGSTDENTETVAAICRRLDGLPLAIELAAPRVRTLTPQALLRRLDQRLPLLTGGAQDADERQRTLRDTIAWSYDLLLEREQALFRRLGVFVGGFRLEAAAAVGDPDGSTDVLEDLDSLVEKSLLLRLREDSDGEPRFWMLETIREYALEQLAAAGELESARRRHGAWFAELAECLDAESGTGDQPASVARLCRRLPEPPRGDRARPRATGTASCCCGSRPRSGPSGRPRLRRRGTAGARGRARARRPAPGPRAARALLAARLQREQRRAARGRPGGAARRRGARRPAHARAGVEPARPRRGDAHRERSPGPRTRGDRRSSTPSARNLRAERAESIGWLMMAANFGPLPVEEGIARCRRFHDEAVDDPFIRGNAWSSWARSKRCAATSRSGGSCVAEGLETIAGLGLLAARGDELAGGVLRRDARRRPRRRRADRARRLCDPRADGRAGLPLVGGGAARTRARRAGELDEAERFSRTSEERRRPTTSSRRCSGARPGRRSAPAAASWPRPRRWPARRSRWRSGPTS